MIQKLFKIFLNLNHKVTKFEEDIDDEETKRAPYYRSFFNEELDPEIYDDVCSKEHELFKEYFKNKNGISPEDYFEYSNGNPDNRTKKQNKRFQEQNIDPYTESRTAAKLDFEKYCTDTYNLTDEELYRWQLIETDVEDFVKVAKIEHIEDERYDAYGSCLYQVENEQFVIFGSYDNGSNRRYCDKVLSLCCYNPKTFKFELGDILYDKATSKYYLSDIQTGIMPEELREGGAREISGKRNWRWNVDAQIVNFRCTEELRAKVIDRTMIQKFGLELNLS